MTETKEKRLEFKWPVTVERYIDAPPEKIWSVISMPGNLKLCHPFCDVNEVLEWPGVGARDVLRYYSGLVFEREFIRWTEGVGYDLLIGSPGGKTSMVSWQIIDNKNSGGRLRITVYPYLLQRVPLVLRWLPQSAVVGPQLRRYLGSVVRGFAWYIETGQPIQKNQFGSHRWFSTT